MNHPYVLCPACKKEYKWYSSKICTKCYRTNKSRRLSILESARKWKDKRRREDERMEIN